MRILYFVGLTTAFIILNVDCRDEFISERDLSSIIHPKSYAVYTPEFVEVRAATINTGVNGVYRREESLTMMQSNVPWYGDETSRPVYKNIASKRSLYIYWSPLPTSQWRIGTTYPIDDPNHFDTNEVLGAVPSYAYTPVFTKGWFLKKSGDEDERQIEAKAKELSISTGKVRAPKRGGIPTALVWDSSILVDEARPGTFSASERQPGCPSGPDDLGLKGVEGYDVDKCKPPSFPHAASKGKRLEFTMTGADGQLRQTLFAWSGYFLRRPYFALRSPLSAEAPHGIVEVDPRVLVLWAEGPAGRPPHWYISRELGNKHLSQLFARWSWGGSDNSYTGSDWPAEPGLELPADRWVIFRRPIQLSHLIDPSEIRTMIRIKTEIPTGKKVHIQGPDPEITGDYHLLGEYLGYPYYRQDLPGPGYALFRGHVVSADMDTWAIGSILGSSEGIKAYVNDDGARWPNMIDVSWWIWDTDGFEWKRKPQMKMKLGFEKAEALPIVENKVFPQCPMPSCPTSGEAVCPPTGTCAECLCQPREEAVQEVKLRQESDPTEFLHDSIRSMPKEYFAGNAIPPSPAELLSSSDQKTQLFQEDYEAAGDAVKRAASLEKRAASLEKRTKISFYIIALIALGGYSI